jgi:hypothetical protein
MPAIDLSILNQRQTPAFYADVLANRPAAGFVGRIFVSTNTFAFFRDNGTGWDLIGGPGTGTVTGSGTTGRIPLWNGASTIGDSALIETATEIQTSKQITVSNFIVSNTEVTTQKASVPGGSVWFGMKNASAVNRWNIGAAETETGSNVGFDFNLWRYNDAGTNLGFVFRANRASGNVEFSNNITAAAIIKSGGTSTQFLKADGSVDSNTYNTGSGVAGQVAFFSGTNAITGNNDLFWDNVNGHLGIGTNVPGTALQIDHDQTQLIRLNQTTATNDTKIAFQNSGTALWRIGNSYNAGANDFGIFDVIGAIQPITVKKTTGQVLIGTSTVGSGKLVVASSTGDNGVQIVGAAAPSLRIDNAESGPTKRAGLGISTATNNFIQGSADRDFCMFNGSTTASPILFGIYGTTNVQEAARISAARNFLIGTNVDNGQKLQVIGSALITGNNVDIFTATGIGTSAASGLMRVISGGTSVALAVGQSNATRYTGIGANFINVYNDDFFLTTTGAFPLSIGTNNTPRLTISSTGAATFSSDVTASNGRFFVVNTFGYYFGDINNLTGWQGSNGTQIIQGFTNGSEKLRINSSGNLLIGTTTDNGNRLQVNGSINGAAVYAASGFVNETQTISTPALVYSFDKDQGAAGGSSSTTFNITGLPNTDGTIAYIYARSSNTTAGVNASITIQINGNTVFAAVTQNVTKTASFAVYRQNGSWVTIDGGTGGQLTYP